MKTYGQFCPIAIAAEIFAERWTPLIVRELLCGSTRFSEIERGLPRVSKSVLAQRLRALETAGVIERWPVAVGRGSEYGLTPAGRELGELVLLLGDWGKQWGNVEIGPHNVDPELLMWDMHRRIHVERLPDRRVVVQVELTGARRQSAWLVLERPEPSVCLTDPGFEIDLWLTADTVALHRIWVGQLAFATALRDELIVLDGPAPLRRAFPDWLALGIYAWRGT
jgi:DNA-binding HxlR family transcriptional regulator